MIAQRHTRIFLHIAFLTAPAPLYIGIMCHSIDLVDSELLDYLRYATRTSFKWRFVGGASYFSLIASATVTTLASAIFHHQITSS